MDNISENNIDKRKHIKGASLVEYALLAALISILCMIAIRTLGQKISGSFSTHASQL